MSTNPTTSDLSAELFVALQRLNGAISLYRSYYTMVGFIAKTHYSASHVDQQENYTAEQWLSDFFANKTGLIPNFLDMNQCVPQSPEAAGIMLGAFLEGLRELPELTPREGGSNITLFEALRDDIRSGEKSRKLRGTSPIYLSEKQKEIGLELIDDAEQSYRDVITSMSALIAHYPSA